LVYREGKGGDELDEYSSQGLLMHGLGGVAPVAYFLKLSKELIMIWQLTVIIMCSTSRKLLAQITLSFVV
jgi:hypothetical protein